MSLCFVVSSVGAHRHQQHMAADEDSTPFDGISRNVSPQLMFVVVATIDALASPSVIGIGRLG